MPKEITHWIIAAEALKSMPAGGETRRILLGHSNLFYLGTVIPDTPAHLLYDRAIKAARELDSEFHVPAKPSLETAALFAEKFTGRMPETTFALLAGTLSHIITDSVFHPFVNYFAGPDDLRKHYRIETLLDVYFLKQGKSDIWLYKKLVKNAGADADEIAGFMHMYFDRHSKLKKKTYKKCIRWHCILQSAWSNKIILLLLKKLSLIPGLNIGANIELFYPDNIHELNPFRGRYRFLNPVTGEQQAASIDELKNTAVNKISELLKGLDGCSSSGELAGYFRRQEVPNPGRGIKSVRSSEMKFFTDENDIDQIIFGNVRH